jgi:molecular chaperone GrpE (heat shock protein)
MEQPVTRAEFERYVEEQKKLKEEVEQLRQWKERHTDEVKAVRVEVASEDVVKRLDDIVQALKRIDTKQDDHGRLLKAHSEKISTLQTAVSDLPTNEGLEALLIRYLQPKPNGH